MCLALVMLLHPFFIARHVSAQSSNSANLDPTTIALGTRIESFLQSHKDARYSNPFQANAKIDIKQDPLALTEKLRHPLFSDAYYTFQNGRLVRIYCVGYFDESELDTRVRNFIQFSVDTYKIPTSFRVVFDGQANQPAFFWEKEKEVIKATYSAKAFELKPVKKGYVSISVGVPEELETYSEFPDVSLTQAQELRNAVAEKAAVPALANVPIDLSLKNQSRPLPHDTLYLDSIPTWGDDNLRILYWSRRNVSEAVVTTPPSLNKKPPPPRTGMEIVTQSLSMIKGDGSSQAIISLPPDSMSQQAITWNSVKRRIAFELNAEINIFDFATGSFGKASQAGRVLRGTPAWSPDGQYLAMAGSHSPSDQRDKSYHYDQDIFVSRIADEVSRTSNVENWCVAQFPGAEILPIFTPDGQYIIFAHLEPPQRGQKSASWQESQWALYRVKAFGKAPKNEPPVKIVGNLPYPTRLSWYPDGTRLLVSYTTVQGVGYGDAKYGLSHLPEVIDIRDGTRETLKLLPMFAPGMGKGVPLIPENIVIDNLGLHLAFNAFTWSGDSKDTAVAAIYSCDLNGANVQQHSPNDTSDLTTYDFKKPGVTAKNAWDLLQPKANVGTVLNKQQLKMEQDLFRKPLRGNE